MSALLSLVTRVATRNDRGFDANTPITGPDADRFVKAGFTFALRYVPRETAHSNDLTRDELTRLVSAGLAVMPVQHVESESSWMPTDDKGRRYGQTAADTATALGMPTGTTVWLDLEGVAGGVHPEDIIRYCNYWHDRVAAAGFQPGLYIGWRAGLTPIVLYGRLKFARYWSAYNLNADQMPAVRSVCMRQRSGAPPAGVTVDRGAFDLDEVIGDRLGGFPTLAAPDPTRVLA